MIREITPRIRVLFFPIKDKKSGQAVQTQKPEVIILSTFFFQKLEREESAMLPRQNTRTPSPDSTRPTGTTRSNKLFGRGSYNPGQIRRPITKSSALEQKYRS